MPVRKGLVLAAQRYDGKGNTDRARESEQILADHVLGMRATDLATKYSIGLATVYRRIDEALAARIVPTVDAYREKMNAALDDQLQRWEQQVSVAEDFIRQATIDESYSRLESGFAMRDRALTGQLRVLERRAKLNGLDAPVKVEHTVTVGDGVEARVEALMKEVS